MNFTHIHPALSKQHVSHPFFSLTTSSHFLLSLFCLTELLFPPPGIFLAILPPETCTAFLLTLPLPDFPSLLTSFLGSLHLHPSCNDHQGLGSSSPQVPTSATTTHCALRDSERSLIRDSSQKNLVDFHPISKIPPILFHHINVHLWKQNHC